MFARLINIIICVELFFFPVYAFTQVCNTDSNYYSITYRGPDKNYIADASVSPQNEIVALFKYSASSSFVSKFTSQGNVIWSNEYAPNYPHTTWNQYPWYNNTQMNGILAASDSTYYLYGQSTEHGLSINNVETPPTHLTGILIHIDRSGNVISGKNIGNWYTDYTINKVIELSNGNLIIYARSFFFPYTSKLICVDTTGTIIWAAPLKPDDLYADVGNLNPVIKELKNGRIVIGGTMVRNINDSLIQPFLPLIILPGPLHYFKIFEVDANNGNLLWQNSYQCPPLTNTSAEGNFVPEIKNIVELPDGKFSICADMFLPTDHEIYWKHTFFSKRAVNIIASDHGDFLKLIAYHPQSSSCSLQNAFQVSEDGEQLLLAKDSISQQLLLFQIDNNGQVKWSKAFENSINATDSKNFVLEKQNKKGYYIFQTDPSSINFHLSVTNATGNNPCTQIPVTMVAGEQPWPWYVNKALFLKTDLIVDFGYAPFNIIKKADPLTQHIDCQYQEECCKDVIDSLHPHNISLCENEMYTLPDGTVVKEAGNYYFTLKTKKGCDSIVFYNVKVIKSPEHLATSSDTCFESATVIQLRASEGYETYTWNNITGTDPFFLVNKPGNYTVTVKNVCGMKTDTIHVYDKCSFPIYFPTAFTPNRDFKNDLLRVPPQNKNKLISLRVYNRWGQLVFYSTKKEEGWDGTINGVLQPMGTYIYFLQMEGFSGEKINQKGSVVLIR